MALLAAALNPAFVHQGVTILAYLPSGNPLTLESLLYGLAAGAMLGTVALWFVCVTDVITSDKVVYLFGRVIPALSLLLSMILRFVPRFVRRLRAVAQAQRHLGRDTQTGAPVRRVRSALRVFSIVVTWSLESGLITADSMRCRAMACRGGPPSPSTALTGVTVPLPFGWLSAACICWAAVWPAACAFSIIPC